MWTTLPHPLTKRSQDPYMDSLGLGNNVVKLCNTEVSSVLPFFGYRQVKDDP